MISQVAVRIVTTVSSTATAVVVDRAISKANGDRRSEIAKILARRALYNNRGCSHDGGTGARNVPDIATTNDNDCKITKCGWSTKSERRQDQDGKDHCAVRRCTAILLSTSNGVTVTQPTGINMRP